MMTYGEFKREFKKEIFQYLPEKYNCFQLVIVGGTNVNSSVEKPCLVYQNGDFRIGIDVSMKDLYQQYLLKEDCQVFQNAAELFEKEINALPIDLFPDVKIDDHIIMCQLVNTEQNREMLQNMPHREYNDLSVVYRLFEKYDQDGMYSVQINNEMAKKYGVTEAKLFRLAMKNNHPVLRPKILSMYEVLIKSVMKDGMPAEVVSEMFREAAADKEMWVISNECKIYGASAILHQKVLDDMAKKVGTDFYLLPSSIHEWIAVSTKMGEPDELAEMVYEINMSQVVPEERLSNQVYHYDREKKTVTLATDTPHKRLDGRDEEPGFYFAAAAQSR